MLIVVERHAPGSWVVGVQVVFLNSFVCRDVNHQASGNGPTNLNRSSYPCASILWNSCQLQPSLVLWIAPFAKKFSESQSPLARVGIHSAARALKEALTNINRVHCARLNTGATPPAMWQRTC